MDIRKLQRAIVDGLEDVKAQNIAVFNTEHLSPLFERVIIASGTSNRQTKALASSVRETVKGRGMQVMRTEGEDNGEWIIVDCGAAVVHVMQPAIRDYYHLEEIWGDKPVKLKLGSTEVKLVKASEEPAAPAKTARKGTASKPITAKPEPKPAAKSTAAKSGSKKAVPSAAAKKAVAKKAAAGTQAPRKGVTRSVGVKAEAPAKTLKVGAGQGVGKAASAKRPAAVKTTTGVKAAAPARKAAAKKAPAKTAAKPVAKSTAKKG
jgi:ribosome-associated protein